MSSAGITLARQSLLPTNLFDVHPPLCPDESIWIYLSVGHSMMPLRVLESDSIESVKLRIQSYRGFVVKNQKLICGGRELSRSDSLIRDYGVADGNVLHLVLRLSDLLVIKVRTTSGKEFTFHVERGRDVGYVKQKIAMKVKEFDDIDEQEVVCDGEKLEDQRLIDHVHRSHNDAVIHLLVRKSAKVRAKPVEKNYELSIEAPQCVKKGENAKRRQYVVAAAAAADEYSRRKYYEADKEIEQKKPPDNNVWLEPIIVNPKVELPSELLDMVDETFDGLIGGNDPVKSMEGTGGAYFMQDSTGRKFVSVFKPIDEEPLAVNNPQGLPLSPNGEGLKKGTRVGEGALREVAAYILDHPIGGRRALSCGGDEKGGFAGVPPTAMVKCLHKGFIHLEEAVNPKIGSLQMFMENNGSCEDIGPGAFPVEEVHKIALLDIRLANADRHAGNILFRKDAESNKTILIPIDHGYCLPESFEDCTFEWLYWPQAHRPFDEETVDYVRSLDAEDDIALLRFHGWDVPTRCARTLYISTMLLKKGVEKGISPFDIGTMMCRETLNKESVIEEIVHEAEESVLPGTTEAAFLEAISEIMDRRLNDIVRSLRP